MYKYCINLQEKCNKDPKCFYKCTGTLYFQNAVSAHLAGDQETVVNMILYLPMLT